MVRSPGCPLKPPNKGPYKKTHGEAKAPGLRTGLVLCLFFFWEKALSCPRPSLLWVSQRHTLLKNPSCLKSLTRFTTLWHQRAITVTLDRCMQIPASPDKQQLMVKAKPHEVWVESRPHPSQSNWSIASIRVSFSKPIVFKFLAFCRGVVQVDHSC